MAERMLVTQALDEKDLLVKKLEDKIGRLCVVDIKKKNEEKVFEKRETVDEFTKETQAA